MHPIEELENEHGAIRTAVKILEEISRRIEAGQKVKSEDLSGLLDFIRTFADRCHHAKEEGLLFPAMEKAGVPRERGPIGVMLAEHEEGRSCVKGMAEAVNNQDAFAEQARKYADLLARHIEKEDKILYPMAERRLSGKTWEEMEKGFEKIERDVVGPGRHEAYHRFLHRLEETYLAK